MPMISADFSGISSSFEPLEGEFRFRLVSIDNQVDDEEWKTKNAGTDKQPALVFISEVVDGDRVGAQAFDYIYMQTKQNKPNKIGLGRIKAYAEAILGKEAAASTSGIDTDALLQGEFLGIMKKATYKDKTTGEEKFKTELVKIMLVG
jgi:hypothetical protein